MNVLWIVALGGLNQVRERSSSLFDDGPFLFFDLF